MSGKKGLGHLQRDDQKDTRTSPQYPQFVGCRSALTFFGRSRIVFSSQKGSEMSDEYNEEDDLLVSIRLKSFKALLRAIGQQIDPETAEVEWTYIQLVDPYGVFPQEIVDQHWCVGRGYFARAPGSDLWVEFGDLPDTTVEALWRRIESQRKAKSGTN